MHLALKPVLHVHSITFIFPFYIYINLYLMTLSY